MVREADIIKWKLYNDLLFIQCACRFTENCTMCDNGGGGSKRQEIKALLKQLFLKYSVMYCKSITANCFYKLYTLIL